MMNENKNQVFAFEVWPVWKPEWATVVNHRSAGKAKADVFGDLRESYPDIPFTDMRARKLGRPQTDRMFAHVAQMRDMPQLRCGQRASFYTVRGGSLVKGVLVKAGGGANFGLLCDYDSAYPNQTVYVHPSELILEQPDVEPKGEA